MKRRNRKRYSFTVFLAASMVLGAAGWVSGIIQKEGDQIALHVPVPVLINQVQAEAEHTAETDIMESAAVESIDEKKLHLLSAEEKQDSESVPDQEEEMAGEQVFYTADSSYFDDALFIGDSRTVGLHEYGNLGSAEVVADSGMNVYKIFEKEFAVTSGEKKQLETVLRERKFGKIYLMLGINELGYDFTRTVSRYTQLLDKIRELQPGVVIYLEANLHITGKKSEESPIYTNENINRFNQAIEQMADGRRMFYLDINELFDDESGSLGEEYTMDHAHVLGKYYTAWADWLLEHAVVSQENGSL